MKKSEKILATTQYIFLTAILLLGGYYVYCMTWNYKIVEFKSDAIMEKSVYKIGDELTYTVDYCKYLPLAGKIYPELTDGVVYGLRNSESNAPVGCGKKIMSVGRTPNVHGGTYYIRMKAIYRVNPFREVTVEYHTNEFIIISDKK